MGKLDLNETDVWRGDRGVEKVERGMKATRGSAVI